jgi:hypothetical protein
MEVNPEARTTIERLAEARLAMNAVKASKTIDASL